LSIDSERSISSTRLVTVPLDEMLNIVLRAP
jgi:hypothetical protein